MLVPRQRSHCANANADIYVYMIIGYTPAYNGTLALGDRTVPTPRSKILLHADTQVYSR